MGTEHQDAILTAMADPSFYEHRPERVDIIQTHISELFVAPPYIYKVKKPKNLGFLDFTTLEKRRHYCAEELALNRRTSEDVYLAVEAVVPDGTDHWRLADESHPEAEEYCLKMRYLPPEGFLDRLLEAGLAAPAHLERVANLLADFYDRQRPDEHVRSWGAPEAVRRRVEENYEALRPFAGTWLSELQIRWARRFTERFFSRGADLLTRRQETQVLDTHGDVHTQQIHYEGGAPDGAVNLIDCIEFNEAFRCGDTAGDIAFLLMDLIVRNAPELGDALVRRLDEQYPDADRGRVLPLYLSYRAFVRAKVACIKAASPEVAELERAEAVSDARLYLRHGTRFALAGATPTVIAFCGLPASGKSTLSESLAEELGAPRHASDLIRRSLAGLEPDAASGSPVDGGIYSKAMDERTYGALAHGAVRDAERSGIAIADATYLGPNLRAQLESLCRERGVRLTWVALDPEPDLLRERIQNRSRGESEATLEVLERHLDQWVSPDADEGDLVLLCAGTESADRIGDRLADAHADHLLRISS